MEEPQKATFLEQHNQDAKQPKNAREQPRRKKANNVVLNGTKIFFTGDGDQNEPGDTSTDIESDIIVPTDSDVVDCAKSGVSLGKFLSASVSSCK